MIATGVFSAVLLLVTVAVMQIGRTYYKGITSTRNQEVTRSILDEISQAIQFGSGDPNITSGMVCAGGKRFSYQLDTMVSDSPETHALRLENLSTDCSGATPSMGVGREMLGLRMRLAALDVAPLSGDLYRVTVRVVTGDDSVLTTDHQQCKLDRVGAQFCAASELTTVVQKRVR